MQRSFPRGFPLPLLLLLSLAVPASAGPIRLVASDPRGVTLALDRPGFTLSAPNADGRSDVLAPGLEQTRVTGRPMLPVASTLVAIPPGARVSAHVIGETGNSLQDNVRLRIAPKPVVRDDGNGRGAVPTMEAAPPVLDGSWPTAAVEVGTPFTIRHQWVVAVRIYPFRYDAAGERLTSVSSLTVRVDFSGGASTALGLGARDEGQWEPVLRGSLINYKQGLSLRQSGTLASERARPVGGLGVAGAFDEGEPEVRVQLDTTGVYAIEYDELANHDYPAAVPDSEVSVHRHEYVEDPPANTPPYVTIELPIEVEDFDQDGVFGPGDRILVFCQSWAERSRASFGQREWGDGEVVFATRVRGRTGLRLPSRPGYIGPSVTPLASYPWTQRWEQNNFYVPVFQEGVTDTGRTDMFVWVPSGEFGSLVQLYAEPDSFRFETNDLDTTHTVRFVVTWRGTRTDGHYSWAHLRNAANRITSLVDSANGGNWFGRDPLTRSSTLFGSALSEGNRNVLRAWGRTNPCSNPVDCGRVFAVIDWFQATYWRRFKALNEYLSCNSGGVTGDYEIQASGFGFPDRIHVWDVTDSLAPQRLVVPDSLVGPSYPYTIRFQDNAASGVTRKYVVFDRPRSLDPSRYGTVKRRQLTLRSTGDYLLIVPEAFLDEVEPLRALRASMGLEVVVAPLEAVNDEFNGGRHSAYAIRRFVRYAYKNWNAQFVLLVGDGSDDPQHFIATSTKDWVPAPKIGGPDREDPTFKSRVPIFDGYASLYEAMPSDPWYVWCVDCPSVATQPKIQDLFIGRLPANSVQQVHDIVDKIVHYEDIRPEETWRKQMLLLADDDFSTQSTFGGGNQGGPTYCLRSYEDVFLDISRHIRDLITDEAGLVSAVPYVFDLGESLRTEPRDLPDNPNCRQSWAGTQQSTRIAVTPQLLRRLRAGVLLWNFQGHANPSVLTHEDLYVNRGSEDDKDDLLNADKPFLFAAFSCHPNTFSRVEEGNPNLGPSLGEDMLMLPSRRGAVASWGSTGYEIIPFNAATHLNVHFARALFARASWDSAVGAYWDGRVILGQSIAKALIDNLPTAGFLERDVGVTYNLLGDPATRFSVGASEFAVRANGQDVVDGEPVRLVSLADTLRLDADIASNTAIRSITLERTDDAGTRVIPATDYTISPAPPDTLTPGAGRRTFHLSYFTTLDVGSYRYTIRTVDANGVPGSFDVVFRFYTVLRADGASVGSGDVVRPDARLELLVLSPRPIADPSTQFRLEINGHVTPFTATPSPTDPSGREWLLTWSHDPYPSGTYVIALRVADEFTLTSTFTVQAEAAIQNAFAFPNPFDDDLGTHFTFTLAGSGAADLLLRVFTVSGRLVYEHRESGVSPGYHQIAWNGLDGEQDKLANGVYLYRLIAHQGSTSVMHEGRLVKLRKPVRKIAPGAE